MHSDYPVPEKTMMVQAICAALQSVGSEFVLHSFHCCFLRAGAPCLHQQLPVYASDNSISVTAFRPHSLTLFSPGVRSAILDHKPDAPHASLHHPCRFMRFKI
jgi:acyl-CoA thioesterase